MNSNETKAGISPVLSTDGLAGVVEAKKGEIGKIDTTGMSDGEIYEAVSRRKNPEAHARIDALIANLPRERECCGTFPRTPHRATCAKYRGKFKPANRLGDG